MVEPPKKSQKANRDPKSRINWRVSDLVRNVQRRTYEVKAKATGQHFVCGALQGDSEYNITINSDRTLSCNCQDYDGGGHLGDLSKESFPEVFFGATATRFREELWRGKLPLSTCARCVELRTVDRGADALPPARLPHKGLLLENTVRCNVDCVGCAREGAASVRVGRQLQMPLEQMTNMADLTASLGLEKIFYLNQGEPFLSPTICKELPMLRAKNPKAQIILSTNGILIDSDEKREAAMSTSLIYFSLHGVDQKSLERYMKRCKFDEAYDNMRKLVEYRNARGLSNPVVEWKYLLFNWNDHPRQIEQAKAMAEQAGVDILSFWPTNNPFYGVSWRWRLGRFRNVGAASWKGREIDFRLPSAAVPGAE